VPSSTDNDTQSAVVNEPRGSDPVVGALLCPPSEPTCVTASGVERASASASVIRRSIVVAESPNGGAALFVTDAKSFLRSHELWDSNPSRHPADGGWQE
jgi:Proline racemase.